MDVLIVAEGRYYEDIVVGEVRESSTRTVTREELLEFATRYDPQYFHVDPAAAADSIFGEIVRWICGVAWEDVRWPNPIRAGDELKARSEMLSKRRSRSDPSRGVVECRYSLLNQHGELVFVCRSVNLIEMRASP
jgi:acyl dehydratase